MKTTETTPLDQIGQSHIDFALEQVRSYPFLMNYYYPPELQDEIYKIIEDKEK